MKSKSKSVLAAGHICLDIIPKLDGICGGIDNFLIPGSLYELPPTILAPGGSVSNTGCTLHRLGVETRLIAKLGNDAFGKVIQKSMRKIGPNLADDMIITQDSVTAHSIVLSKRELDRIFLCCSGANDEFSENDIDSDKLATADLLHLGYPPLLKKFYENEGESLGKLLLKAKLHDVTVSLDMSKPAPDSPASRVKWKNVLKRILPHVDIFAPSLEETIFMLNYPVLENLYNIINHKNICGININILESLADELLSYGSSIVIIKLGSNGLYLRTTRDIQKLQHLGRCKPALPELWLGRQLLVPCFVVNVCGTTGAGDSTIAGFIAGLVKELPPWQAATYAVATGACCVEQIDATSGITSWDKLTARINAGWARHDMKINFPGWKWNEQLSAWAGPDDSQHNE